MRILGVKNLMAKILVFTLFIYFYAAAESTSSSDVGDGQDSDEVNSAEIYENNMQDNYQTGFVRIVEFFNSMTDNFSKMNERMGNLETMVSTIKDGQEGLKKEMNQRMDNLETMVKNGQEGLKNELNRSMGNLATMVKDGQEERREEILSVSVAVASILEKMPQNTFRNSTDCGGNLELGRGFPLTIRYANLGNNQSCVWKIGQQVEFASYRIRFKSVGTETRVVGVLVYYGNSIAEIKSKEVTESGTWITIPGPNALITFGSTPSNVSSGFEASIFGLGTSSSAANLKSSWFGNSTEAFNFLFSESFAHFIATRTPLMKSTGCGGILEVARGVPSTIRYPNSGNYRDFERCVWTIAPKVKFASYHVKIQYFGMEENYDGVKVYFWDSGAELQSQKITNFDSWISIPAPYVVITFCSDGSTVGGGFGASIVGWGTSTDSAVFKPFWLTGRTGSFSYPQDTSSAGSNNEMVSVVVQPPNYQSVTLSLRVPQIGSDTIKPYQLTCSHYFKDNQNHLLKERNDGGSSSSATYQFSSDVHPFLVIFKSNGRNDGVRFTLSY